MAGPAAGLVDLLRSTFVEYCKVQVGPQRLLFDPSAPKMSSAQYLLLCQDAGVLEPEGGNLTASSIGVVFNSYKPVNHQCMPFQHFVRSLSALSTSARTNVHQLVADLAGHIPHSPSIAHIGKLRPYSSRQQLGPPLLASTPGSRQSFSGTDAGFERGMARGDMDVAASADAGWPPGRGEFGSTFVAHAPRAPDAEPPTYGADYQRMGGAFGMSAGSGGTASGWDPVPSSSPLGLGRSSPGSFGLGAAVLGGANVVIPTDLRYRTSSPDDGMLRSASDAGGQRPPNIPAWSKDEGMPPWLNALMDRLDALDQRFGNPVPGRGGANGSPSPVAGGRPPAGPDALRPRREQLSAPAGETSAADLSAQVSELRQLTLNLTYQVASLTSRVQRVETQLSVSGAGAGNGGSPSSLAGAGGPEEGSRGISGGISRSRGAPGLSGEERARQQELELSVQRMQAEMQEMREALQRAQEEAPRLDAEQRPASAGATTNPALSQLERQVQMQQEELHDMNDAMRRLLEVTQALQQREESKQEVFRTMLARQTSVRGEMKGSVPASGEGSPAKVAA